MNPISCSRWGPLLHFPTCCSPQVSCVSGTPDQISDDKVRIPRLHGTFPISLLPMLLLPRLPTAMTKFSFRVSHTVLLWFCVRVMLMFLPRCLVLFPPLPPLLLFALQAGGRSRCPLGYGYFRFAAYSSSSFHPLIASSLHWF
jgi:hypothetical protein